MPGTGVGKSGWDEPIHSRCRPYSEEDDQHYEKERFRRVHRKAGSAKGRSILHILQDRSFRGQNSVHGKPLNQQTNQPKEKSKLSISTSASTTACKTQIGSPASGKSVMDFPSPPENQLQRAHMNSTPCKITNEIRNYGELYAATKFHTSYLLGGVNESTAVSTISIAFSSDGDALASTHGDHTVKITCCHSGRVLNMLEGHPRTPWTVKFHPTNKYIVASGCLGYQVRVWDWSLNSGQCLNMIRLRCAIISLAFHPTGNLLAVASGSTLYLWAYNDQIDSSDEEEADLNTSQKSSTYRGKELRPSPLQNARNAITMGQRNERSGRQNDFPRGGLRGMRRGTGTLHEMRHEQTLRCVHFPPEGKTIIVGGVNPTREGGIDGMIFSLTLWDFDIRAVSTRRINSREVPRSEPLTNVSILSSQLFSMKA